MEKEKVPKEKQYIEDIQVLFYKYAIRKYIEKT